MKEIISKKFQKMSEIKSLPSLFHNDGISKEDGDSIDDNIKRQKKKRRRKTKMLYQLNRPVDDVTINQIRE
jgi:hypothetical protein